MEQLDMPEISYSAVFFFIKVAAASRLTSSPFHIYLEEIGR